MKRIDRICPRCDKVFHGHKSKVYCSAECRAQVPHVAWNAGKTGLPANRPRNGATKQCVACGTDFYVPAHRLDAQYCSMACYTTSRWGAEHRVTRPCVICDKPITIRLSDNRTTCSDECSRTHKSRSLRGERSHMWRGGKMAPYVGEWNTQNRAARARDGHQCRLCGSTDRIQVHHIIPYRYSHSHDLDNLVTLCRSCHSREELKVNGASRDGLKARWQKLLAAHPAPIAVSHD